MAAVLTVTAIVAVVPAPANPVAGEGKGVVGQHVVSGPGDVTLNKAIEVIRQSGFTTTRPWQSVSPKFSGSSDRTLILGGPEVFPM